MNWVDLLLDAGLSEREAKAIIILSSNSQMKAGELAKELGTTRLDAYNSLSRLTEIGIVTVSAERPMKFSCNELPQVVEQLITDQEQRLSRTRSGFEAVMSGASEDKSKSSKTAVQGPKFAVLKERHHIMKKIGTMAESSEERLVLLLGKFGILHLCRSPAIEMVNTAAKRGVVIQVLAQLDRRTIRFYENIDASIEIRHSDDVSALGVLRDNCEVIQYLYVDENPVGKGRDESALLIESEEFADSHTNLVDAILSESVEFAVAEKRFSEERIVDPLKLTIGAGSFLDNFRQALGVEDKLPDEDTPFEPESFLASSREVNSARSFLQGGELQNLDILGIDLKQMLRQVGNRIGEELAFSLRGIDSHIEFLNEMMDWWEHAGLGDLSYEFDPLFQIKVGLTHPPTENPNDLPLWELDDGIIQGTLKNRYPKSGTVKIIRDEGSGESDDLWRYTLLIPEFES
ncbi:MAG: Uncharacterised protein [Methanobacteriota archaeon]|nr:MAG: Uncharacterised protein [Euryarchaeota archaeon]|tara:strand:+ start:410 stop:1789 length:1380 start_codon:yes stop_codon:yes gene_type:complete